MPRDPEAAARSVRALTDGDEARVRAFIDGWSGPDRAPGFLWTAEELWSEARRGEALAGWTPEGRLAGLIAWRTGPDAAEVMVVAVHPEERGQGWGRELLLAARQIKFPLAWWLEVHEGNQSAIELYRSLGFQQDGRRPRYFRDGGAALTMSWRP